MTFENEPHDRELAAIPRLLLAVPEASRSLGIGRSMIYKLIAGGQLVSVKIGGARRISFDSLVAFVHHLEKTGPTPIRDAPRSQEALSAPMRASCLRAAAARRPVPRHARREPQSRSRRWTRPAATSTQGRAFGALLPRPRAARPNGSSRRRFGARHWFLAILPAKRQPARCTDPRGPIPERHRR